MEDMYYSPVQGNTQVSSEDPNIINHSSDNSTIIRSTTVLPDVSQMNPNILVPNGFSTPSPLRKSQRRGSFSSILRRRSSIVAMTRRASKDIDMNDEKMAKFLNTISLRTTVDTDDSGSCYSDIASNVDIADYDQNDWFLQEDDDDDEPLFTILEKEELENKIIEMAETLSSQIDLTPGIAILLLQYFRWDLDKILNIYFDDPDKYLMNSGAILNKITPNFNGVPCLICFELYNAKDLYSLNCGHGPYCLNCWKTYLHEEIMTTGPEIIHSKCISPRCNCKLTYEDWKVLASLRDYHRYWYFIAKDYVYNDKHLVFCPSPTCGSAIKYQGVGRPNDVVECKCGTRFCFSCGCEKHNPVSCAQLTEWKSKNNNDQESVKLIMSTCKPCYHCGMPTERVQGCNHMVCRKEQGGCGGEWCWMCRGDWKTHGQHTGGFYSCNKYETSDGKKDDESTQTIKKESERFLHHFNRYFNHDMLMKHAIKMKSEDIEDKMNQFRELTNHNPDFLMEALDLLIECRRILKYTYVFGYYLSDSVPGKMFFEYQQANAEGITELLSEGVYINVALINPEEMKNRIRVTRKYIDNLVKSIEEGLGLDSNMGLAKTPQE